MGFLEGLPAVARIGLVFVFLLAAIRKKVSFGSAFAGGSALLGLLFGMAPVALLTAVWNALLHPKTLALALVVCLILVLSRSMETCGQMQRLLQRFEGLVRQPSVNLITFPMLIGLLPMPGGAVFSAPMVRAIGASRGHDPAELSFINYWFRHIWEYWWPLYPGILLITALAGIDLWHFVAISFPMTVVALLGGFLSIRRSTDRPARAPDGAERPPIRPFFRELTPVLIVISGGLGLGALLTPFLKPTGLDLDKEAGLVAALVLAVAWVWRRNSLSGAERWRIVSHPEQLRIAYMVAGILVFKGVLEASGAVAALSGELVAWRIPLVPVTVLLPFLVGGVAGITIAFVGTTFPILISLILAAGEGSLMPIYLLLGLVSGFTGVLLSPLHLCLQLSNSYFQAPASAVYRRLWIPCLVLLGSGGLYFWLFTRLSNAPGHPWP
jgi:integral membrane protein (TIGR00529 family)